MTEPLLEEQITALRKTMRMRGTTPEGYTASFGDQGEAIFVADLTQLVWLIFGANMNKEMVNQFVMEVLRASTTKELVP
jgi:hypothetical protein